MKRKFPVYLIVLLGIVFTPTLCLAVQTPTGDYVIGPGDKLDIQVWENPDLGGTVEVSRSGDFSFPLIGKVHAAGLSVFALEKKLTQKLAAGYLVSPQVRVRITEYSNQKVFLFGAVKKPGSYVIKGKTSILELISSMGGITDDTGVTAIIVRPESPQRKNKPLAVDQARAEEIIRVDLERLAAGEGGKNIFVMPGDSIYVKKVQKIFVTGEVRKPGKFNWEKNLTVREAISLAGGPSKAGASERTQIIRIQNGQETHIRPKMSDFVKPDDIIKVPKSYF